MFLKVFTPAKFSEIGRNFRRTPRRVRVWATRNSCVFIAVWSWENDDFAEFFEGRNKPICSDWWEFRLLFEFCKGKQPVFWEQRGDISFGLQRVYHNDFFEKSSLVREKNPCFWQQKLPQRSFSPWKGFFLVGFEVFYAVLQWAGLLRKVDFG
jgi:hypothetical protein